ncbi:MAG: WYL domain-containing protein, partial [Mycobacteriales bacterium]
RELGYAPAAEAPDGALLLATREARRTPARPRPSRGGETVLPIEQARLAVTALRAGDVASRASHRGVTVASRTSTSDTLAFLQDAAREGRQVWIGYVDAQGRSTSRVVQPRSVEGGFVSAYDHLRAEDRTFAVHRITGVAAIDDAD